MSADLYLCRVHLTSESVCTMENASFNVVKKLFKSSFQAILSRTNSYEIDEAALPAYAHRNPLIDWLFWQRLKVAYRQCPSDDVLDVLDFGCGSGILSYLLASRGHNLTGIDIEFGPLDLVRKEIHFPENIDFIHGDVLQTDLVKNKFDVIVAMDVLEHIDDLDPYILRFKSLLKEGGRIIVSGPTENIFYKIGRKLAGDRFTGDYHVTSIGSIRNHFESHLSCRTLSRLLPPVTLFEVFEARV